MFLHRGRVKLVYFFRFFYVRYREIISRVLRIHTVVLYRKVNPWLGGPSYQYPPSSCIAHCDEAFRRNMIRVTIGILNFDKPPEMFPCI